MSDIVIQRTHGLSPASAKQAADKIASELAEEFDLDCQWEDDKVLHFERYGLSGQMSLSDHTVEIQIHLGFLLFTMRHRIEREIHRYCDENFGPEEEPSA